MKNRFKNINVRYLGIGCVVFFSALIYSLTIGSSNPNYADSGELITTGYLFSVPHPPGYPLQTALIYLFTHLPIPGTIAFRANLLTLITSVASLVFVYLIQLMILDEFIKKKKDELNLLKVIIASTSSLIIGFSTVFWIYSIVTEVFALHNLLAVLTIFLGLKWRQNFILANEKLAERYFYSTLIMAGVGVSHIQSFLLLFPGLLTILLTTLIHDLRWKKFVEFKTILTGVIVLSIGFIGPNLLLFLLNNTHANFSWFFQQDISGWLNHIRRQDYAGFIPERDTNLNAYVSFGDAQQYINNFIQYFKFLGLHFEWVGLGLGILGMIYGLKKNWRLTISLFVFYIIIGFGIGMYLGYPNFGTENLEYNLTVGVHQRQHLLGEVMFGLFIGLGILSVYDFVRDRFNQNSIFLLIGTGVFSVLFLCLMIFQNFSAVNQKNRTLADNYSHDILNYVDEDSIIICSSDFACFSLAYARYVEGMRPDVALVTKNSRYSRYFYENNDGYREYDYVDNPYAMAQIVSYNMNKRPTYLTDADSFYVDYIGLEGDPFFLIPGKYVYKVSSEVSEFEIVDNFDTTRQIINEPKQNRDYWYAGNADFLANYHNITALVYSHLGMQDMARMHFLLAIDLDGYENAQGFLDALPGYYGDPNYKIGSISSSSAELVDQAKQFVIEDKLDSAYKFYQLATFADLHNTEAKLGMIKMLLAGGYFDEAVNEYQYILKYDPDNVEVQKSLERLKMKIDYHPIIGN